MVDTIAGTAQSVNACRLISLRRTASRTDGMVGVRYSRSHCCTMISKSEATRLIVRLSIHSVFTLMASESGVKVEEFGIDVEKLI